MPRNLFISLLYVTNVCFVTIFTFFASEYQSIVVVRFWACLHVICFLCQVFFKKKCLAILSFFINSSMPMFLCVIVAGWDWRPLDQREVSSTESRLVKPIFTAGLDSDNFCQGISTLPLVVPHCLHSPQHLYCSFILLKLSSKCLFSLQYC